MSSELNDLCYLTLTALAARIRTRKISCAAVTRAQLDRIASLDGVLHSYAIVSAESAMTDARAADTEIAEGKYRGVLHGVPIAVKDLFWTRGTATAGGMAIYKDFVPTEDATAVHCLRQAGAVLLGKLQLTEGAYSDHHASITAPVNPWNASYWPGISSSGAAVATAAGLCYGALASDTGGSIRWPAAANGLTGLKPSWGRVSRHGCMELAATLDHVGTIARSAEDAGTLLAVIAGSDPADPTSSLALVPEYVALSKHNIRGLRVGIDAAWNRDDVDPVVHEVVLQAIDVFRNLGAEVVAVQMPAMAQTAADWAANCAVEAAVAHEASYAAHRTQYGPVLASVIDTGLAVPGTLYRKILARRLDLRAKLTALLGSIDVLLCPVQPFGPLTLERVQILGMQPVLIADLQRFTIPFNLTGHPTLTLPGGFSSSGLPIAFQLVAGDMAEETLVRSGVAFQRSTVWHSRHPMELS